MTRIASYAMVCILSILMSNKGRGAGWTAFDSYRSFLNADASSVGQNVNPIPLNRANQLDNTVLTFLGSIVDTTRTKSSVAWGDGMGSSAHPLRGILIDRKQLAELQRDFSSSTEFRAVLLFVVAHEHAHMRQYEEYGKHVFLDKGRTRQLELQADILAGAMVGIVLSKEGQSLRQAGRLIPKPAFTTNTFAQIGSRLGHPAWDDATVHPRSDQRFVGAGAGLDGGLQWIFLENHLGHKRDGHEAEAQKWLEMASEHDKKWPFMPQLDSTGDKPEYSMVWSKRVAEQMLQQDFNYYEFVREHRRKNGVPEN